MKSTDGAPSRTGPAAAVSAASAATGVLVHRLIRHPGIHEKGDDEQARLAREWIRRHLDGSEDEEAVIQAALAAVRRPTPRERVLSLLGTGEPFFEVPFSICEDGVVIRGSIDCLIRSAAQIHVIEFKTGSSAPEHEIQRDVYVRAAQAMFPNLPVEGHLIYL